ncbi:MAG: hypothetical protein JXA52_00090, partial [Planctomycetes bacterium]|nr:hypothetical protein [Planctomycetota bacterium]
MCGTPTIKNVTARVVSNEGIAPDYYRMVIACESVQVHFAAGQFFQLRLFPDKLDPLLRRPFAPSEFILNTITFIYLVVGTGTKLMTGMKPGEPVEVLLPLGNGYTLPTDKEVQAVLVGGGCGMPSLRLLAAELAVRGNPVYTALGAPQAATLLEVPAFQACSAEVVLATDDGSGGIQGTAVDAAASIINKLDSHQPVELYACGPMAMLRGLAKF